VDISTRALRAGASKSLKAASLIETKLNVSCVSMFVNTTFLPLVKIFKLDIPSLILALISEEKGVEFNIFK
jgi:hypothetical protein